MNIVFLSLIFVIFMTNVNALIHPKPALSVLANEGFIAYLEVPKSFGVIKNCWFKFRDDPKIKLENSSKPLVTDRGEVISLIPLSLCGIRVNKVSSASAAPWTLEAENLFGDFEKDVITISILPAQKIRFDTRLQREIGTGTISCTKHETYTKYCKIIDNVGKMNEGCQLQTTLWPNSSFECLSFNWGRMEESHEFISIDVKDSTVYSIATIEDNELNTILRCQFKDTVYSCQAKMPDHKHELFIMDGLYNGRYSTFDTQTKQSRCSLEIPKPLTQKELGLWRIINHDTASPTGCLFYVGNNKTKIIEEELKRTKEKQIIKLYEPQSGATEALIPKISCTVPYVVSDCYLKDPNNAVYFPDAYKVLRQGPYGTCEFANMPVIKGTWVCAARGRDYEKEVLQEIEVLVAKREGEVLTKELKAKKGDTMELMCTSSYDDPISHCAFIDPEKKVHLVGTVNSIKTAGHVQYFGRGLQFGECGAKISKVEAYDFGEWKCQFKFSTKATVSLFNIELRESATAHATSVGLGIGISVIILLFLGVVIGSIFYRRRNIAARRNFPSTDPLEVPSNIETSET